MSAIVASLVSSRISYIDELPTVPPSLALAAGSLPLGSFPLTSGKRGRTARLAGAGQEGPFGPGLEIHDRGAKDQGAGHVAAGDRTHDALVGRDQDALLAGVVHDGGGIFDRHVEV